MSAGERDLKIIKRNWTRSSIIITRITTRNPSRYDGPISGYMYWQGGTVDWGRGHIRAKYLKVRGHLTCLMTLSQIAIKWKDRKMFTTLRRIAIFSTQLASLHCFMTQYSTISPFDFSACSCEPCTETLYCIVLVSKPTEAVETGHFLAWTNHQFAEFWRIVGDRKLVNGKWFRRMPTCRTPLK